MKGSVACEKGSVACVTGNSQALMLWCSSLRAHNERLVACASLGRRNMLATMWGSSATNRFIDVNRGWQSREMDWRWR